MDGRAAASDARPDDPPVSTPVRDRRVCFVGDSFVAGAGDPEHLGWVGRLAARSEDAGRPLTAYNLGVRRETSAQVLARWHAECLLRLPPGSDSRIVVSFGVNDTTQEGGAVRVPSGDSVANLHQLLRQAAAAAWPVLVVGPPPVADRTQNGRIERIDEQFGSVCARAGVGYIGVFPALASNRIWTREVALGDGAHPSAGGYEALAGLVWPAWLAWTE